MSTERSPKAIWGVLAVLAGVCLSGMLNPEVREFLGLKDQPLRVTIADQDGNVEPDSRNKPQEPAAALEGVRVEFFEGHASAGITAMWFQIRGQVYGPMNVNTPGTRGELSVVVPRGHWPVNSSFTYNGVRVAARGVELVFNGQAFEVNATYISGETNHPYSGGRAFSEVSFASPRR